MKNTLTIHGITFEVTPEQYDAYMRFFWSHRNHERKYLKTMLPTSPIVMFEVEDERIRVEDEAVENVMLEMLMQAVAQLTKQERKLLQALYSDGLSIREYADKTGIPFQTIHRHKKAVIEKLREILRISQKK